MTTNSTFSLSPLRVGAVAYNPKVVTIWEGLQEYLRSEAGLAVDVSLFLSYPSQVGALLDGRIDVAWNTNLAYLQSVTWSNGACRPVGMRDTDLGWRTIFVAPTGAGIDSLEKLRGRTLALGSRDSGHSAILPVHFLGLSGLREHREYHSLRFDTDLGKHGDTGTSEQEVLKAVLDGRAEVGALGSPFWNEIRRKELLPSDSLTEVWASPSFSHCMFTGRPGLTPEAGDAFLRALQGMSFTNPRHRTVLEAEGLHEWIPPHAEGYDQLRAAAQEQGLFEFGNFASSLPEVRAA